MKDILESPRMYLVAAAACATVLGLAAGWGLSAGVRADRSTGGPEPAGEEPVAGGRDRERLTGEVPDVPGELREAKDELEEGLDYAGMLEVLEAAGMRVIPKRALHRLNRPAIREEGGVSEAVAQALMLSDEEVERVNRAIAEAEAGLRELELERMEVVAISDERAVFRFGSFEDEGAEVEASLRRRLLAELGDRDGGLFWDLMEREPPYYDGDYWRGFGRDEILIVFTRELVAGTEGGRRVELKVEFGPPLEGAPGPDLPRQTQGGARITQASPEGGDIGFAAFAGRHHYLYEYLSEELQRFFIHEP